MKNPNKQIIEILDQLINLGAVDHITQLGHGSLAIILPLEKLGEVTSSMIQKYNLRSK